MATKKMVGAHVSISGGVFNAPLNAKAIGANAFAMFLKNQRQWSAKEYDDKTIDAFRANMKECGFASEAVLPHDGYLINLGSPDSESREKSMDAFLDEARRTEELGLKLLNFHPGSHLRKISEEECLKLIAEAMNETIAKTKEVVLVIENTAGQGSNLGYRFEHLARLIELTNDKSRVGVCLDTCHMFASGYELRDKDGFERTFAEFDSIVGFSYLRGMHINDSKGGIGSKLDRHDNLGEGAIGMECFRFIMSDSRFDNIPLILETPNEDMWPQEIKLLRSFEGN
ncbi:MAG: deoxyribonuclease IV [Campylobacteraceae bacterium]|jgi:deoxyribonuclease-4|nr:deoxyribonuclease IV [Campylobacteraceae bacterium]